MTASALQCPVSHQLLRGENFFFFFLALLCCLPDLSSPTRDWTWAPAVKAPSPNHWTARELPTAWWFFCPCSRFPTHLSMASCRDLVPWAGGAGSGWSGSSMGCVFLARVALTTRGLVWSTQKTLSAFSHSKSQHCGVNIHWILVSWITSNWRRIKWRLSSNVLSFDFAW